MLDEHLSRLEKVRALLVEARLSCAKLELGDHPIAAELRALGLPKRALMCSTMLGMKASFGAATTQ